MCVTLQELYVCHMYLLLYDCITSVFAGVQLGYQLVTSV